MAREKNNNNNNNESLSRNDSNDWTSRSHSLASRPLNRLLDTYTSHFSFFILILSLLSNSTMSLLFMGFASVFFFYFCPTDGFALWLTGWLAGPFGHQMHTRKRSLASFPIFLLQQLEILLFLQLTIIEKALYSFWLFVFVAKQTHLKRINSRRPTFLF